MGVVFLVDEKSLLLKILQGISTIGNGFIHGLSNLSRKFINPIIEIAEIIILMDFSVVIF